MKSGSFWANDWVQAISKWFDHHSIMLTILVGSIVPLLIPKTWNTASEHFEGKQKKLLLIIAILMILAIPLVFYLCSR
jgi:hypothetical protein